VVLGAVLAPFVAVGGMADFANLDGGVAIFAEELWEGNGGVSLGVEVEGVIAEADSAVWQLSCEQCVAGSAAGWGLDVVAVEGASFGGQFVHVWGVHEVVAVGSELWAQVVDGNEQHIGRRGFLCGCG